MNVGENPNPSKIACVGQRARCWAFLRGVGVWTANIAFPFGVLTTHILSISCIGLLDKYAYAFSRGVRPRLGIYYCCPMHVVNRDEDTKGGDSVYGSARRYNCLIGQSNGGCENYAIPNGCKSRTAITSMKLRAVLYSLSEMKSASGAPRGLGAHFLLHAQPTASCRTKRHCL
ncbi:hypothetical protein BC629DRAFT_1445909 [Irpex lacteus]|nr:hypothetical protein BC629DRAFT_1445909 [Irpex lacteus]